MPISTPKRQTCETDFTQRRRAAKIGRDAAPRRPQELMGRGCSRLESCHLSLVTNYLSMVGRASSRAALNLFTRHPSRFTPKGLDLIGTCDQLIWACRRSPQSPNPEDRSRKTDPGNQNPDAKSLSTNPNRRGKKTEGRSQTPEIGPQPTVLRPPN